MKKQLLKTMLCLSALFAANQTEAQITLVETPGTASQDIGRASASGTNMYFIGREEGGSPTTYYLWANDGTTSTKLNNMSQLSQGINPSYFFPCGGKTYFFYSNGVSLNGYEPWVTDGTVSGTFMIKDIRPGSSNSVLGNGLQDCFCYNNKIYFGADDGTKGNELWTSDGTLTGTTLVKDIKVGSSSSNIGSMVNYKGEMYFTAQSGSWNELWHSNGTTGGTLKVTNPATLTTYQSELTAHDTCLYFAGQNSANDKVLCKTNGTTLGTTVVSGTVPLTPLNGFGPFINNGTDILFGYQYFSGGMAYRLYKTDGLSITLVKDSMNFKNPVLLNNKVIYKGEKTGSATGGEPWASDGTTGGTFKLNPISWSTAGTFRNVSPPFNNKIYFATTGSIWETDGTVSGTILNSSATGSVFDFTILNTTLYCNAQNSANGNRQELYKFGASTSGINEMNAFGNEMNIFPQPTNGNITVRFNSNVEQIEMRLLDVTGKELRTEKMELNAKEAQFNLDGIAEGMYLLQIKTQEGKTGTKKIIISR